MMGMLYTLCSKCGGSCGIQAQFMCNVKCENCDNIMVIPCNLEQQFKIWHFGCEKCNFKISFEAISCSNVTCVTDNQKMKEIIIKNQKEIKKHV